MAAIISALDSYTPKQFGENGHVEYGWSNSIREAILQFSFQVTRIKKGDEIGFQNLQTILANKLLKPLYNSIVTQPFNSLNWLISREHLAVLYKMIGNTRDIVEGKGEYELTYMMIYTWYDFYPELAKFALKCLVELGDNKTHQYGSWKDIKYFCKYCESRGNNRSHPLIQYAIHLLNVQLRKDILVEKDECISLAAKWAPREKSSFGWLYENFAIDYFQEFLDTANTPERRRKAVLKCKTEYRKLLSGLNKRIDTLQIKQCGRNWSAINFDKVTSISITKQKKAFLNIKADGSVKYPDDKDRVECAEHFKERIKKAVDEEVEIKGKRVSMADFTKQATNLLRISTYNSQDEIELLNLQWRDNSTQNGALNNMIAMVDVSGSMDGDPMNVAIALGIRIAEKSTIGKRVLTFSSKPTWVNLEHCPDFVSAVSVIKNAEWGMNTNFYAALDMILDAIIVNRMEPQDVQDMVLVVLSDMQIDSGDGCDKTALYKVMEEKYENAGIRVHGKPYKPPHILFWNLRSTSGFPALSSQPNCSMMSGFSPSLLNLFCDQGIDALQSCNPWSMLVKTLENERYKILEEKLFEEVATL
jgi:Mg-chelatase subunit ChlD